MRILAIDAGTLESGYVLYDTTIDEIVDKGITDNPEMLIMIENLCFDVLAYEKIVSFGMAVGQTTLDTCEWNGRFIQVADSKGLSIAPITRRDVKVHLCNSMMAKDTNIRQSLLDRFGKDKTKGISKHMWSALAIAVLCQAREDVWDQ